jgi:DNA ligase D-like protein (predicted polymerase)
MFEGVRLTHPDRILYPGIALTKLNVARYYTAVGKWALPHLSHRLLTLVRATAVGKTFYQKHVGPEALDAIRRFELDDGDGSKIYPYIENLPGLVALVQMDVVEIHPWGSTINQIDNPDRVTFDLDPDEGLPWQRVTEAAVQLREALFGIGLKSFAKTTGGKGLHVVVPLVPKLGGTRSGLSPNRWRTVSSRNARKTSPRIWRRQRGVAVYILIICATAGVPQQSAPIPPAPASPPQSRPRYYGTRSKMASAPTASRSTPSHSAWPDLTQIRGQISENSASHSVQRYAGASGFDDGAVAMWAISRSRPRRSAAIVGSSVSAFDGPSAIAATGVPVFKNAFTNATAAGIIPSLSGLITPPGSSKAPNFVAGLIRASARQAACGPNP